MIKRIGLLTSGGDCQALNATMRGVVKGLTNSIDDLDTGRCYRPIDEFLVKRTKIAHAFGKKLKIEFV